MLNPFIAAWERRVVGPPFSRECRKITWWFSPRYCLDLETQLKLGGEWSHTFTENEGRKC
jgi:hypothetical protein